MIHWVWLIPAVIIGGIVGLSVSVLCVAAKRGDSDD